VLSSRISSWIPAISSCRRCPSARLTRATYSAYNGGPGALGRYRIASTVPALKKVDEAFWAKFRSVSAGKEMGVKSCYSS
jgi:hypothetical protein